jgi:ubiquinone/menaquinone biosynthesis C-methylase UbiE
MGVWADHVLPRIVDRACSTPDVAALRAVVCAPLAGTVVEVGFGSGLNLPHLPASVERLIAVDPAVLGRRLAAERLAACPVPVDFVGLDGEHLPLADASADHVVFAFTLCTVPDPVAVLREARRVLRPGGRVHAIEHTRSPDARTARRQRRWTPVQRRIAGGCELDRDVVANARAAGLDVVEQTNPRWNAPGVFRHLTHLVAAAP